MSRESRQRVDAAIRAVKAEWAKAGTIYEIRDTFEAFLDAPAAEAIDYFDAGGVPSAWIGGPPEGDAKGVVLYCHGGGFQIGSIRSHFGLMSRLSCAAGMSVLGFDYRLAPEHRSPAAHQDALTVFRWMLDSGFHANRIALVGDSAGASLVLGIVRALLENPGQGMPGCLALISPWLDPTLSGASYESRRELDVFSEVDQLRAMARTYVGKDGDPNLKMLHPLESSWSGAPPSLVHVGDHDITRDDGVAWADRAGEQGVDVTLKVWPEMYHHFQVFPHLPEATASIEEIGAFLSAHSGGDH